jgi:hypothetical protein
LHNLREALPEIYERERTKYDQRESVLEFVVPKLGVAWGATVNLSALDPAHLVAARRRLGVPFSSLLTRRILRIPVERIAHLPAVRYDSKTHWLNSSPGDASVPRTPPEREFVPFDPFTYEEVTEVPELHLEYLRRQLARKERALGFVFVPHVLVAGPIDVSGLESQELPGA